MTELEEIDYKIDCYSKYEKSSQNYEEHLGALILRRQKIIEKIIEKMQEKK